MIPQRKEDMAERKTLILDSENLNGRMGESYSRYPKE